MTIVNDIPPRLLSEVIVQPLDAQGQCVVKNPRKQRYLKLGEQESFLIRQLDGEKTSTAIIEAFENNFREPLSSDDLQQFVKMVDKEGLVQRSTDSTDLGTGESASAHRPRVKPWWKRARKQSLLFFRVSLFNPDRFLNWLEPKTRWLFGLTLAIAVAIGTVFGLLVTWTNRHEIVTQFANYIGWQTVVLAFLTMILITICHEFGHGLACKRFGGEVREMGLLWIFFTPCFYCNVSDAWLLANKWHRVLISLAGTYVDLLIWIASVIVWRVSNQDTAINYVAWIIVTTCGVRVAFNINPLLRLDGYYALSDFLGIHNLRRRSRARWMEFVRWGFWGAARPKPIASGGALLSYGITSWFFTVGFLSFMFLNITAWLQAQIGLVGFMGGISIFVALIKRYFKGSLAGEFSTMFKKRRLRLLLLLGAFVGIWFIPIRDRAGGPFKVRPMARWEVRAPVPGFLREVLVDEGDFVAAGSVIARMEVPELTSQITRKEAEINESEAKLRRLEAGARPEVVAEQRERVDRGATWSDLAKSDLKRARQSFDEELSQLDARIAQARLTYEYQSTILSQAQQLYEKGGLAGRQLLAEKNKGQIAQSELLEAEAQKRSREAAGLLAYEGELARRVKALADSKATLLLLEAGTRPEEIEEERAHLRRLKEESNHFLSVRSRQVVLAPEAGIVTTPRLKERIGQFLDRGVLIGVVEDPAKLEAELAVSEEDARALLPGQPVQLKLRALPFRNVTARVDRIAPVALGDPLATQNTVTVYCRVDNSDLAVRTGMTGFGRINLNPRPLGVLAMHRTLRFIRTEFWW